jgi:hypothetical protein
MLPIASSSGPAFIGVVVIGAALFLRWLLRGESRDEAEAKAETQAGRRIEQRAAQDTELAAAQQAVREPDDDRLSAP